MEKFLSKAFALGFSEVVLLDDLSLDCTEEMRAYCDTCPNHGQNWVCPPNCGTLDECRERASEFNQGILVQSITELTPPTERDVYGRLGREHRLRFRELVEVVEPVVTAVLPLASGGCIFCEQCCFPEPCIKPEMKMESLSAFGVDVTALCEQAGLPFSFREDKVYFTALLLVK
ncbi:MAG: DUF2284 domain-containing protein [Coriobacteriia bacterium]|nr:DUF2284 domain-containing protein [Coriobacteriia bacterium]